MIQASKCFNCLNRLEKEALKVRFMALALQAFGGANYTDEATRNQAVAGLVAESDFTMDSMEVAVWQKLASLAGASNVDVPIDQLRAQIACHPCGQQKFDRASWLFLLCQLTLISR